MELKAGIEPATSPLPRVCSTTEPLELDHRCMHTRKLQGPNKHPLQNQPPEGKPCFISYSAEIYMLLLFAQTQAQTQAQTHPAILRRPEQQVCTGTITHTFLKMERETGLEPATLSLEG